MAYPCCDLDLAESTVGAVFTCWKPILPPLQKAELCQPFLGMAELLWPSACSFDGYRSGLACPPSLLPPPWLGSYMNRDTCLSRSIMNSTRAVKWRWLSQDAVQEQEDLWSWIFLPDDYFLSEVERPDVFLVKVFFLFPLQLMPKLHCSGQITPRNSQATVKSV